MSTPNFLRIALTPSPRGVISSSSTTTASPGSAPRTQKGPVMGASGWPSDSGVNGVGTVRMSLMSAKAPRTSIVISAPGSMVATGGVAGLTSNKYHVFFMGSGLEIRHLLANFHTEAKAQIDTGCHKM